MANSKNMGSNSQLPGKAVAIDPKRASESRTQLLRETNITDLAKIQGTLLFDRALLEVMAPARHLERVQLINGRGPGSRALRREGFGRSFCNCT